MVKYLEENFDKEIKDKKILVDFFATWCGPCKMLGSVIEKFGNKGIIDIIKVDIDKYDDLAQQYNIYSVPTLIIFENGVEKKRISGFMMEDELEKWVTD